MNTLYSILVAIDVLLAIGIIGLILIQHGKGADVGAAFGSGASGTVFGSKGSASFLTRLTAILATLFFLNSLTLAYLASNRPTAESVIDNLDQTEMNVTTDIPEIDEVSGSDVPSEDMGEDMDVGDDMPVDAETDDAAMKESLDDIQDSMDSVKDKVDSTLDTISPDDVPE